MRPKIPSPRTRSPVPQFEDRNPGCVSWLVSHVCVEVLDNLIDLPGVYRPECGIGALPKGWGVKFTKGLPLAP